MEINADSIGEIFDKVRILYPDAVIAGGCMRDFLLKKKIKDIDIYTRCFSNEFCYTRLADLGFVLLSQEGCNKSYSNRDTMVKKYKYKDIPVDIIHISSHAYMTTAEYIVEGFDYGICKVFFDGEKVHKLPEFIEDEKNKTITLLSDSKAEQTRVIEHYKRIKAKYPDYEGRIK